MISGQCSTAVTCSTFTSRNRFLIIVANGLIKDLAMNKIVLIDENLCVGCEKCVKLCPKKILLIDKTTGKCKVTDETQCDKRRGCEKVCPTSAIKIH